MGLVAEIRRIREESDDQPAQLRFNLGPLASRLNVLMQITAAADAVLALIRDNYFKVSAATLEEMAAHFNNRLDIARGILLQDPASINTNKKVKASDRHRKDFGEKPFSSFTREEIEEMRDAVDRLVRKLKNIVSRRWAARKRGNLDIKKTLRASAKYNGVPVDIHFHHKALRKSRVVTLCDLSGSVWAAGRFMLNLLYSLQECFDKVSSFVFVDQLTDVTKTFEEHEISEAIRLVLSLIHISEPTRPY